MKNKNLKIYFIEFVILFGLFASPVFASLTLTSSSNSIAFESITVSNSSQTTRATLSGLTVSDDRSASPGWTVVLTSSNLTSISAPILINGSNDTVDSAGSYDGTFGITNPLSTYTLTISTAGQVGIAKFDLSGAETESNLTTGAFVSIGTKGVRATFSTANYVIGDQWKIIFDTFPYTSLQVLPGSVVANSGSLEGISAGSTEYLSGTNSMSNGKVIMSASSGNGTGNYSQDIDFSLYSHANSLSGEFLGVIILTIS